MALSDHLGAAAALQVSKLNFTQPYMPLGLCMVKLTLLSFWAEEGTPGFFGPVACLMSQQPIHGCGHAPLLLEAWSPAQQTGGALGLDCASQPENPKRPVGLQTLH